MLKIDASPYSISVQHRRMHISSPRLLWLGCHSNVTLFRGDVLHCESFRKQFFGFIIGY